MTDAQTITLELDVSKLTGRRFDEDGDPYDVSIEEMVVERAAEMLVHEAIRADMYTDLKKRVENIRDNAILEQIGERIENGINQAKYRRTDEYGSPRTGTKEATLAEHVETLVREQLGLMKPRYGSNSRDNKPILENIVNEAVSAKVGHELRAEFEQAKSDVRKVVASKGAQILEQMIADAAKDRANA